VNRGFFGDLGAVANRSLRQLPRDMPSIIPALFVPVFFYAVTIGALSELSDFSSLTIDYKAFQLPVAIITTVTGLSRAAALVTDIKGGYFDRLLLTPINRVALLLGLMVADMVVFLSLCFPVVGLGIIVGVDFPTGGLGIIVFILFGTLWGLMYTGFPYAIALKTGNPTAVNNSFLLFFPFVFLTSAWLPQEDLSGWLAGVATWNPVTYMLEGMRSLFMEWDGVALGKGLAAILGVGLVAQIMAFAALRGRVRNPWLGLRSRRLWRGGGLAGVGVLAAGFHFGICFFGGFFLCAGFVCAGFLSGGFSLAGGGFCFVGFLFGGFFSVVFLSGGMVEDAQQQGSCGNTAKPCHN